MWDPQAIELLALCLALGVFLAVVLIVLNCVTTCYHSCKRRRRKEDVELLPETYVDEIRRLLDRHKKVMEQYDSPRNEYDFPSSGVVSPIEKFDDSEVTTPARSRSNSVKLRKIKEELAEFQEKADYEDDEEAKRRTWGGLCDSVFDPIPLPTPATDVECQTTATLDRMRVAVKIETTV